MNKSRHGLKDSFDIDRYKVYRQAEYQARYRGEEWEITFDQWCQIWRDKNTWAQRGRGVDDLSMTRRDPTRPWSYDNVMVLSRLDQIRLRNSRYWGTELKTEIQEWS